MMRSRVARVVSLVVVALVLSACTWQCGAGQRVNQSVVYENNGLVLIGVITVCGMLALAFLVALGGPMGRE